MKCYTMITTKKNTVFYSIEDGKYMNRIYNTEYDSVRETLT